MIKGAKSVPQKMALLYSHCLRFLAVHQWPSLSAIFVANDARRLENEIVIPDSQGART